MKQRPRLPEADRLTVKAALRALIARIGGLKNAAIDTGLTTSALSLFQSVEHADLPSLETVALLERAAGVSLVTAFLAQADAATASAPTQADCAVLAREAGEAVAKAVEVCADNSITAAEARAAARELTDLIGAACALQRKLNAKAKR